MREPSLWRVDEPVRRTCRGSLLVLRIQFASGCVIGLFALLKFNAWAEILIAATVALVMLDGFWKLHLWPQILSLGLSLLCLVLLYPAVHSKAFPGGAEDFTGHALFLLQTVWNVCCLAAAFKVRNSLRAAARPEDPFCPPPTRDDHA